MHRFAKQIELIQLVYILLLRCSPLLGNCGMSVNIYIFLLRQKLTYFSFVSRTWRVRTAMLTRKLQTLCLHCRVALQRTIF
jgi:hypothetical protein